MRIGRFLAHSVFVAILTVALAATVILTEGVSNPARAKVDEAEDAINWAYATWVGTGYYEVGERRAYIMRIAPSKTLRKSEDKKIGFSLLFPFTFGYHDFFEADEELATATFVPGVRVVVPVLKNWWLKPFGQVGIGQDFSGSDPAFIYAAGLKSLATFPVGKLEFDLGNSLTLADHNQSGGGNDRGFSMFEIGLNGRYPLNLTIQDQQTNINVFFVVSRFINTLEFVGVDEDTTRIHTLYRVGVSLNADEKFRIWKVRIPGIGTKVTFGDDFFSIGLTMGFPF